MSLFFLIVLALAACLWSEWGRRKGARACLDRWLEANGYEGRQADGFEERLSVLQWPVKADVRTRSRQSMDWVRLRFRIGNPRRAGVFGDQHIECMEA